MNFFQWCKWNWNEEEGEMFEKKVQWYSKCSNGDIQSLMHIIDFTAAA